MIHAAGGYSNPEIMADSSFSGCLRSLKAERIKNWNPDRILTILYHKFYEHEAMDVEHPSKMGYLHIFPNGIIDLEPAFQRWKWVVLKDNHMRIFLDAHSEFAESSYLLVNGNYIWDEKSLTIRVSDRRGHYLGLMFSITDEAWMSALKSCIEASYRPNYVTPSLRETPQGDKNVLIVDVGGFSIRAGVFRTEASLPDLHFPAYVLKSNEKNWFGAEGLEPVKRLRGNLESPFSCLTESLDVCVLKQLLSYICSELKISQQEYKLQLVINRKLTQSDKKNIAVMCLLDLKFEAINMTLEPIASLHGCSARTAVIVDVGDKIHVVPVCEGYAITAGEQSSRFGGKRLIQELKRALILRNNIRLSTDVEDLLVRFAMEELCYVSLNYLKDKADCSSNPHFYKKEVCVASYFDEPVYRNLTLDIARFQVPEGLFQPRLWGLNTPSLKDMIIKALQSCPVDYRLEAASNIILAGGLSNLRGLAKRIEQEVAAEVAAANIVTVHSSPYSLHMSYLGCYNIINSADFKKLCVSRETVEKMQDEAFSQWYI